MNDTLYTQFEIQRTGKVKWLTPIRPDDLPPRANFHLSIKAWVPNCLIRLVVRHAMTTTWSWNR